MAVRVTWLTFQKEHRMRSKTQNRILPRLLAAKLIPQPSVSPAFTIAIAWSCLAVLQSAPPTLCEESADAEAAAADREPDGDTFSKAYQIPGLPQQDFLLNQNYPGHKVWAIRFRGTRGFVIEPGEKSDPRRRWVWISPCWLAFKSPTWGDSIARKYVEGALAAGFHVVGLDVGTTCGSPAGAALYEQYYEWVVERYQLCTKARMLGVSNGGLISYAWAFRHADQVEQIFCVYPATDMRTWPGLERVCGSGEFPPAGLRFPFADTKELELKLAEVNPIDNLKSLAEAQVKIFHIHGDMDELVPLQANSVEFSSRYQALGGDMRLERFAGKGHGGTEFFEYQPAIEFLTAD